MGRDHAGPGQDRQGKDFYGPYEVRITFNYDLLNNSTIKKHFD
jgi:ATP sulfurylase